MIANRLRSIARSLERLEKELDKPITVIDQAVELEREVNAEIRPYMQMQLSRSRSASGIHSVSGDLAKETIGEVVISVHKGFLTARMPSGLSDREYKKAGALQYGYVRGPGGKKVRKAVKKGLQKAGTTQNGVYKYIPPYGGGFYTITASQAQAIREEYTRLFQVKIDEKAR